METVNQTEYKVAKWIAKVNHTTNSFKEEFSTLNHEQLLLKPSQATWSIAENIQHIIEVNQSYFPLFSQLLNKTYRPSWSSKFSYINNIFGKLILKSVNEDRKKRIKTFPLWIPAQLPPAGDILTHFETHQQELTEWIQKLEPYIGKETVVNSPANKLISYTLDDAIQIIIMHEKRHFNQAREVKINME